LSDTEVQGQNTEKEKKLNRSVTCVSARVALHAFYKEKMLTIVENDSIKTEEILQG
jgi:hypothetical protein